jgi:predicted MFS family arabinose efflux permease
MGRLIGTVLSGYLYQTQGLEACLFWSSGFILATVLLSCFLPKAKVE